MPINKNKYSRTFAKVYVLFGCCSILLTNCKTVKQSVVKQEVKTPVADTLVKKYIAPQKATYIPVAPDSISEISINLVGDLMCHTPQTNNARLSNGTYDFNPSFEYIKAYLQDADITIGNLETTFAGSAKPYAGYPAFNSPDEYCTALKNAGFDFLVTANNHSMDTGEPGLLRTIETIKKHNLGYAGTYIDQADHDSIRILNIKGIKLGILNYTYGTNGSYPASDHKFMLNVIDSASIVDAVKLTKAKGADIVLVFYHMGTENITEPTQAQNDAVRFALQAGANLIIGAHPHMIGPTQIKYSETIKDSVFIAYSLGNFLSNQFWRYTDAGVILKLLVQKNCTKQTAYFKEASYVPTWVYRGDGSKKNHIVFPAQLAKDSSQLPDFLTTSHIQKMLEALEDTKAMMTKRNSNLKLNTLK